MTDNPADALIDERYLADSAAAVAYVRAQCLEILRALGLWELAAQPVLPLDEMARRLGVVPDQEPALLWLLEEAREAGHVEGRSGGFRPLPPPPADILERAAAVLDEHAPGVGSSKPELDYVASRYPDLLRGERSGPAILLKGPALELWSRYFSAENPLYDVHNELGALGVQRALAGFDRPVRIVELGAGTGGATAALLRRLSEGEGRRERPQVAALTLTDVAPSFLIPTLERLERTFGDPGFPLQRKRLDFNRPPAEQGLPEEIDLLLGVNALHNGPDLAGVLAVLRRALPADGVLVISESICQDGHHVHQDFIFNLLPLGRPRTTRGQGGDLHSRFFSADVWRRALAAAGFTAQVHANTRGPELALLAIARPG